MRRLLLILLFLAGLLILWPYHNFQEYLAQGDHGRDLYAGQAVLRGETPYKDFWWVYGPFMPYYYAVFLKLFGPAISSILLGYGILKPSAECWIIWSPRTYEFCLLPFTECDFQTRALDGLALRLGGRRTPADGSCLGLLFRTGG